MIQIIVSLITGGLTLVGVIITCSVTSDKNMAKVMSEQDKRQAVTDCKIEELTREVRLHNGFAQRIPVLETKVEQLERRDNQ